MASSMQVDPSNQALINTVPFPLFLFLQYLIFADILAHIMNDLFGGVVYAGIDTDRYKYPIGSGRVTFGNQKSFMKAVKAGFVEIKTGKFTKKVNWSIGQFYLSILCVYMYVVWCKLAV